MGSGPSHSSSESHVSENGSAGSSKSKAVPAAPQPPPRLRQGSELSKKDEPIGDGGHPRLTSQSTLSGSTKEPALPPIVLKQRSEMSIGDADDDPPTPRSIHRVDLHDGASGIGDNLDAISIGGSRIREKKYILLAPNQIPASDQVLVKMGSSMLRTKNCSEEFQSLDMGEPIVLGKFDHDKFHNLHPLALERYCLVESSSVSGFTTLASTTASAPPDKHPPIAQRDDAEGSLIRLCETLPLFWLHTAAVNDMRHGSEKLKAAGFDSASVFICAPDPIVFAKAHEDKKPTSPTDASSNPSKKSVFFCLPALVRAAPPSRSLYVSGRFKLSQLERDIKTSIVHLVAQDVASGGTFPAYFGSKPTPTQDEVSIGWTLGKVNAAFADDINTAAGAAAEEFELLAPKISRIQTAASSANESTCMDESEINTISKALLMNYYKKFNQTRIPDQATTENSPVFDENSQTGPKTAVVVITFEDLSPDTCFVLLLAAIAVTLQQEPVPILYRKFFEEIPPYRLHDVLLDFADPSNQIATNFDEFIAQIMSRLFKDSTSASAHFVSTNRVNTVRYAYTFLFSYYCYDMYVKKSTSSSFSKWLRRHYLCYRSLTALSAPVSDILEMSYVQAPVYLIAENDGVPVMSVVSSDFGVRAHGFRKIPPAPVYGSQSPSADELKTIAEYCSVLGKRWHHTAVVWCDLRPNAVVYLDGKPHIVANSLGHPITDDRIASSASDLEQVEEYFKTNLFKAIEPAYAKRNAGILTTMEKKEMPTLVQTPRELAANLQLIPRNGSVDNASPKIEQQQPHVIYYRLPVYDEKAPNEKILQELINIMLNQQAIYVDEDGPAFLFTCATGVGAVAIMMIAATMISYHLNGFPFGCHVGEEERVSIKNVQYTQGNFQAVRELVEQIPRGNQVKREVDAVFDACWDRMTSTFYHLREIIFATFSKVFNEEAVANANAESLYRQSVDYLERYVLLIIFNAYLHAKKHEEGGWQKHTFQDWLAELAASDSPLIATLDNLCFPEFGDENLASKCCNIRTRWINGTTLQKMLDD